jgi:hypothetical protein
MTQRQHKKTISEALGRESVHPFPARMAPGIALEVVERSDEPLRVLDPMMGSGTVLAVARANGHRALGVDIDPLAVLIARVWTTAIDTREAANAADDVLAVAYGLSTSRNPDYAYPEGSDEETREFVRYWFDKRSRRQLAALAAAIGLVETRNVREALWVAFSRLIITKQSGASLAMDLSHSRPHKVFTTAPIQPLAQFIPAVQRVITNCLDRKHNERGPATTTYQGDARALPLRDASVDLVLTSPPYLNAIDYMRCSKFSLVWMGYSISELRQVRSFSVGSEAGAGAAPDAEATKIVTGLRLKPRLSPRDASIFTRYVGDMRRSLCEVARVLAVGGHAVYVVGENTVKGTFMRNADVIETLAATSGLKLEERKNRTLPANRRYLPPPLKRSSSASMASRMRREVVLSFRK